MNPEDVKGVIHHGNCVGCTREEYLLIRDELHRIAGDYIDSGDAIRGMIALEEVKRLDKKFEGKR